MYQKQYKRLENLEETKLGFIRYVEVVAFNVSIRLLQNKLVTINAFPITVPYSNDILSIFYVADRLALTTQFGLTIYWDGISKMSLTLCTAYSGYVCGLCGNADGNFIKI